MLTGRIREWEASKIEVPREGKRRFVRETLKARVEAEARTYDLNTDKKSMMGKGNSTRNNLI